MGHYQHVCLKLVSQIFVCHFAPNIN
jgi:hypothetical protein